MRIGFGRSDITPRVGVELAGFGPFITRHSVGVRDKLWARAMAVEQGGRRLLLISCDLVGVERWITDCVRSMLAERAGIEPEAVMLHCTHTHSGPNTGGYVGWGAPDEPYLHMLPRRIAAAGEAALGTLQEAELRHAEVLCDGIGLNREYDRDAPPLEDVLRDNWRPSKPELTDTTCHVLRVDAGGKMIGFLSSFGCHPVVCCAKTRYTHGDYPGVATNRIETEHDGATGLFLQGANGDVNSCCVHKPEAESLHALDVIAGRYASAVQRGLETAAPVQVDSIAAAQRMVTFTRKPYTLELLREHLAKQEAVLKDPARTGADKEARMAMVNAIGLRRMIETLETGGDLNVPVELQGFRIGPLLLLASPFETFQAIKNEVKAATGAAMTLVLSVTNDSTGYAPDRTAAARGGYAADTVPWIKASWPFASIHDELVREHLATAKALLESA